MLDKETIKKLEETALDFSIERYEKLAAGVFSYLSSDDWDHYYKQASILKKMAGKKESYRLKTDSDGSPCCTVCILLNPELFYSCECKNCIIKKGMDAGIAKKSEINLCLYNFHHRDVNKRRHGFVLHDLKNIKLWYYKGR